MTGPDLRQWRRRHGLTQARAAECLGLQAVTVSQYERGVRRVPNVFALLCGAYNYITDMGYSTEQTLTVLEHESAANPS
ncbi:helix-turn-helix domain-containing protein [Escherichia coli]|uniref:helix-turn-helix domain-containing protein n=1 Tax=Escherichia coli TaxID=562 RepID=UPI003BFBDD40